MRQKSKPAHRLGSRRPQCDASWPHTASGLVPGEKGLTWKAVNEWLWGQGTSLSKLTVELGRVVPLSEADLRQRISDHTMMSWRTKILIENLDQRIYVLPDRFYAVYGKTWKQLNGRPGEKVFRSFEKARAFVRSQKICNFTAWREYCTSGRKPSDIPSNAFRVYRNVGWISWGDWFGTNSTATYLRTYRSFATARSYVRKLSLYSHGEWRACGLPEDIPRCPEKVYAENWVSWADWLGAKAMRQHA